MGRRARRILARLMAILVCGSLWAYDWPMKEPALLASFGSSDGTRVLPGMLVSSADDTVKAIGPGELLFAFDTPGDGRHPSGLGAFVAVGHERELISVYGGLKGGSSSVYLRQVMGGDILGLADGPSGRARMELTLFDREKANYVNPLLFLSPIGDERAPNVRAAWIKRDAQALDLSAIRSLRQGVCEIQADYADLLPGEGLRAAPYVVRLLVNGVEKANYVYDSARAVDGQLRLFGIDGAGLKREDYLMAEGRYRLGLFPIPRGRISLDLIVSDYARNQRTVSYKLDVD